MTVLLQGVSRSSTGRQSHETGEPRALSRRFVRKNGARYSSPNQRNSIAGDTAFTHVDEGDCGVFQDPGSIPGGSTNQAVAAIALSIRTARSCKRSSRSSIRLPEASVVYLGRRRVFFSEAPRTERNRDPLRTRRPKERRRRLRPGRLRRRFARPRG